MPGPTFELEKSWGKYDMGLFLEIVSPSEWCNEHFAIKVYAKMFDGGRWTNCFEGDKLWNKGVHRAATWHIDAKHVTDVDQVAPVAAAYLLQEYEAVCTELTMQLIVRDRPKPVSHEAVHLFLQGLWAQGFGDLAPPWLQGRRFIDEHQWLVIDTPFRGFNKYQKYHMNLYVMVHLSSKSYHDESHEYDVKVFSHLEREGKPINYKSSFIKRRNVLKPTSLCWHPDPIQKKRILLEHIRKKVDRAHSGIYQVEWDDDSRAQWDLLSA